MDWSGIEGTQWRLRPAGRADEPAIAAHGHHSDPSWIGIAPSAPPERAHHVLEELLKGIDGAFGLVHFAVPKVSEDVIVGMVAAQNHGSETVEIVYGVAPACRGRGLATEILSAVTQAARERDSTKRYELVIDMDNAASIRVAEKCGYRLLGTRRSFEAGTGRSYEDLVYVPDWFQPRKP